LAQPEFIEQHKTTPTAFTRTRKLPFQTLCLFLLNLVKGSTQSELDDFFGVLRQQDIETRFITASAFTQARSYLKHSAFETLNAEFIQQFSQLKIAKDWRGHRLLAVDSSSLRLPEVPALIDYFGGQDNQRSFATMARLSTCLDLNSGLTIDAQIAPYGAAERDLAARHLNKTQCGDLLLYDRGYPAFWLFALHNSMKRDFCMRASTEYSPTVKQFVASESCDALIEFTPTQASKLVCIEKELPLNTITLRALKIALPTGETEVLLTSLLDTKRYPYEDFFKLYGRRWGIEVDYRFKKNKLDIENFTGLSVHAVQQDISAKVLTQNIAMAAALIAQEEVTKRYAHRKLTYKVNVSQCLSSMKNLLVKLFVCNDPFALFNNYLGMLTRTIEAVRPGRSFERTFSRCHVKRFHHNSKRAR
jgi:hypothetical protein